jgi:hypothetical protein
MYAGFNRILSFYHQNKQHSRWHSTISRILKALPIVYQKTPFELQPEAGFIKKMKHVSGLINF